MRVTLFGHRERRAELYTGRACRQPATHRRMPVDATRHDQRNLRTADAEGIEGQHRFLDHASEIKTLAWNVRHACHAKMAARMPRMLDHDGIGQTILLEPLLQDRKS